MSSKAGIAQTPTDEAAEPVAFGRAKALPAARFVRADQGDKGGRPDGRSRGDYGSFALKNGLLSMLGALATAIGSQGDLVCLPGQGRSMADSHLACTRLLWEWLLAGAFTKAAGYYKSDPTLFHFRLGISPAGEATPADTLIAALLLLGGHVEAGQQLAERLPTASGGCRVIHALLAIVSGTHFAGWQTLHHMAALPREWGSADARHLAMVLLFQLYRERHCVAEASVTAGVIFAEALSIVAAEVAAESCQPLPDPASALPGPLAKRVLA
ncbi:MAG: hypothetical protein JNM52_09210 [Betaproteobacteria bacterium]|nr:hypothetical protein [Betaproteobacteria bacterium]